MTRKQARDTEAMLSRLQSLGIARDDAETLRRISMTLRRWHELECGDGNDYGSWTIARGKKISAQEFVHDDDGAPYLEHHHYPRGGKSEITYSPMPDRERGARKRLAKIMARYPTLTAYVQGDPRGCALYVLKPGDVPADGDVSSFYNRGVAVHR
jgi:hypothetical protein